MPDTIRHFFSDDPLSFGVDGVTVENDVDRVALYGSLDITRDQTGLERARKAAAFLADLAATLEAVPNLPGRVEQETPEDADNPFYDD